MDGKTFIDNLFYDLGRYSLLTTDTTLRTVALSWANRVIKDISGRKTWTFLEVTSTFPTIASTMTYDLPADCDLSGRKVISLRQKESPQKLFYISQRFLDEVEPEPDTVTGNPLYYTIFAQQIRLYPVPNDAYTMYMRYIKTITALTDSALSTTEIPAKFDEVVLDGMKVHAFRMFPKWGDSNTAKALFEQGILKMISDDDAEIDASNVSGSHIIGANNLIPPYHADLTKVGT
jgi:hypothetical protein